MGGRAGERAGAERSETRVSDQTLSEPVLVLPAGNAILAAAFDLSRAIAAREGGAGDQAVLLFGGHALPAVAAEPLERAVAHLVLHPHRALDPIAEIDVRQLHLDRAADV